MHWLTLRFDDDHAEPESEYPQRDDDDYGADTGAGADGPSRSRTIISTAAVGPPRTVCFRAR